MIIIKIYISISISYLLLYIKLPPKWGILKQQNWVVCSQSHKLTQSVSSSAEIPRSRLGKVPCVLTHVLLGSILFHVDYWPLFLAQ